MQKILGHPGDPSTATTKGNIRGSKVMLFILSDQKRVVYYELLKPSDTVTAERYQ